MGLMNRSTADVRMFSDDGRCIIDPLMMRRALTYAKTFGGVIAQHAQDPRLAEREPAATNRRSPDGWGSQGGRRRRSPRSSPGTSSWPSCPVDGYTSATCRPPKASR